MKFSFCQAINFENQKSVRKNYEIHKPDNITDTQQQVTHIVRDARNH